MVIPSTPEREADGAHSAAVKSASLPESTAGVQRPTGPSEVAGGGMSHINNCSGTESSVHQSTALPSANVGVPFDNERECPKTEMSETTMPELEEAAAQFIAGTELFRMGEGVVVDDIRRLLTESQKYEGSWPYDVKIEDSSFDCGADGVMNVRLVVPVVEEGTPIQVILFCHGGGWVSGNTQSHDKLIRELAYRCRSVVVFPEYALSPEVRFPTALHQLMALMRGLPRMAEERGWQLGKLTLAGDSAGGTLATVLANISIKNKDMPFVHKQLLYYPVTDSRMDTDSYKQFSTGFFPTQECMEWHWDQYIPDRSQRQHPWASPLQTPVEELRGLSPVMIISAEADVLRDEARLYANKLMDAGVKVTYRSFPSTVHGFVMVNSMDQSKACRAAMDLSVAWINELNTQ